MSNEYFLIEGVISSRIVRNINVSFHSSLYISAFQRGASSFMTGGDREIFIRIMLNNCYLIILKVGKVYLALEKGFNLSHRRIFVKLHIFHNFKF